MQFHELSFSSLVSTQKPFGLRTYVQGNKKAFPGSVTLYQNGGIGYISVSKIGRNQDMLDKYKVYISAAYGAGEVYPHQILGKPILGKPNSCCTETYLVIGPFETEMITRNVISYICTRFFRFAVLLIKGTQHTSRKAYSLVPLQDFSRPWTDAELYAKYNLTPDEIAFIESMIRPMDVSAGGDADA